MIAWNADPSAPQPKDQDGKMDTSKQGPYSVTMVVNVITTSATPARDSGESNDMNKSNWMSGLAFAFSTIALVISMRRRKI